MLKLPDPRDPIIFTLLVVLVIAIVSLGVTIWQKRGLEADLARAEAEATALAADRDAVLHQRDEALRAHHALARMVQSQGEAIMALKRDAEARQSKAGAAARAVLAEPADIPEGRGPEAMNAWLRASFSPPR
jgi:hypothetical protein